MNNALTRVLFATALGSALTTAGSGVGQSDCCVTLPPPPDDPISAKIFDRTSTSPGLMIATVVGGVIPAQDYTAWCVDWDTIIYFNDPIHVPLPYVGQIYSTCDPKLNDYLAITALATTHHHLLVSPAAWNFINYILNHRASYDYWAVQVSSL